MTAIPFTSAGMRTVSVTYPSAVVVVAVRRYRKVGYFFAAFVEMLSAKFAIFMRFCSRSHAICGRSGNHIAKVMRVGVNRNSQGF